MPPKQKQGGGNKVAVDKTFGMKNKNKSSKVQQQAQAMQQAQARKGKSPEDLRKEEQRALEKKAKEDAVKLAKAEALLNKPIQAQKVPFGVDPKTVLCQYYKSGFCEKAAKCKFSHDKDIGRRTEKRNLYTDERSGVANPGGVDPNDKTKDTMDTWDDEKLAKVVLSKYGNPKTTTDIVCKHFIDAVESGKYGWFWVCPNGDDCFYRHALPPGFVLNSDKKKKEAAAKANVITLEEFLESERHKLGKNLTPVTEESFAIWKKTRLDKKTAEEEVANKLKGNQVEKGKLTGLSGRDLFTFNPDWFKDEDDEDNGDEEVDMSQWPRAEDEDDDGHEDGGKNWDDPNRPTHDTSLDPTGNEEDDDEDGQDGAEPETLEEGLVDAEKKLGDLALDMNKTPAEESQTKGSESKGKMKEGAGEAKVTEDGATGVL